MQCGKLKQPKRARSRGADGLAGRSGKADFDLPPKPDFALLSVVRCSSQIYSQWAASHKLLGIDRKRQKETSVHPLALVDLVDDRNKTIDGLVPVSTPQDAEGSHERAVVEQAASFHHVDYVFFRRFKHTDRVHVRSSQITAYVVDNSKQKLTEAQLAELHRNLWLHGIAPLVYVAWPTRVDILSCARKPDFWVSNKAEYRPAERIAEERIGASLVTAADVSDALAKRRRVSALRLAEGTFWDDPANQKLAKEEAAAHRLLIQAIVEADRDLDGANHPIRRRLLVVMVLIKYLEDREVIPERVFGQFHKGTKSFLDLLSQGSVDEVQGFLESLEKKFNGDVFSLGKEAGKLTQTELRRIARLIEAKTIAGQGHLWELFSFKHIPVEVISRLYQRFVTGHGAVYTPPFLAALLLDQVMPYERITGNERVLDPACGSGIFLVGAFKRLVIHWRSQNSWRKPTVEDLKQILSHSIHGVELEEGAVDLTAFSLALAVCDALDPPVIWHKLRFDKLRERNLRHGDFFDSDTVQSSDTCKWPSAFDVIVGNPPFQSKLTPAARDYDDHRSTARPKLPDHQLAYLFLEQSLLSLVAGGSLCLVQPHGLIYNSKTAKFRRYLIKLGGLDTVLDLISVRGIFEEKDPKTIVWHSVKETVLNQIVNHVTIRRTFAATQRIGFDVDHYDWHRVSMSDALDNPIIWRAGLLGGGRLKELSDRMVKMTHLKDFVGRKGWVYSEGFNVGSNGDECDYLTGQPYLPTEALRTNGIDENQLTILTEETFEAPRVKELYDPPLLLIKENASLPMALWKKSSLTFRHSIVGIHAPKAEASELDRLFRLIEKHRRLYRLCFLLIGTRALSGKVTAINKKDIDQLPFPDDPSRLDLAFWEEILQDDTLDYMTLYIRRGQNSTLLRESATEASLRSYSSIYVRMLGSLYPNLRAHQPIILNGLVAQPFSFGEPANVLWLDKDSEGGLHRLIYSKISESLRTIRVVRYYEGNVILIVKPDRLRYWIRSTAIRDADDTLVDLRDQGW